MKRLETIVALLMLALWMPGTSHALLESAEIIHQHADSDSDKNHDHDAADGLFLLRSTVNAPASHVTLVCLVAVVVISLPEPVETGLMDRINSGTSPPLPTSWQFVHRAALPARAPSFAS